MHLKKLILSGIDSCIDHRLKYINLRNRSKIINEKPTIISSNCIGGLIYKWLGLKFYSPFINTGFERWDFLKLLENLDKFLEYPIIEIKDIPSKYLVGKGYDDIMIFFGHSPDFKTAIYNWKKRKSRIDFDNLFIMCTTFAERNNFFRTDTPYSKILNDDIEYINRFNKLPFKNKVIFSDIKIELPNVFYIPGYDPSRNLFLQSINKSNYFKRYIDSFDYVSFLNY